MTSRMQLTGSSSNLWVLQTLWMTYHVSWWQNLLIWRFLHKLLSWNIWRILQMPSRMQLKGSSSNLWACGSNQTFFYEANSLRFSYLLFLYYPCDIKTLKMRAHVESNLWKNRQVSRKFPKSLESFEFFPPWSFENISPPLLQQPLNFFPKRHTWHRVLWNTPSY